MFTPEIPIIVCFALAMISGIAGMLLMPDAIRDICNYKDGSQTCKLFRSCFSKAIDALIAGCSLIVIWSLWSNWTIRTPSHDQISFQNCPRSVEPMQKLMEAPTGKPKTYVIAYNNPRYIKRDIKVGDRIQLYPDQLPGRYAGTGWAVKTYDNTVFSLKDPLIFTAERPAVSVIKGAHYNRFVIYHTDIMVTITE